MRRWPRLRRSRLLRRDEGQALVEFALVAPVLILILFGIIDFGRALNYLNAETNLANVGARYASVIGTQSSNPICPACPSATYGCTSGSASPTLFAYVQCQAQIDSNALASGMTVCLSDQTSSGSYTSGDAVQVTVTYPYNYLSMIAKVSNKTTVTLTSSATMMLESTASTSSWITNSNGATGNSCS
jgi:Flp pilus assembly protein TadG